MLDVGEDGGVWLPAVGQEQRLRRPRGFDGGVRVGRLLERERPADHGLDPARRRLGQRPLRHPMQLRGRVLHLLDSTHGHPTALRLVRVDHSEPAARSAVRGEAAAARRDLERGAAELPAGAVEHHVGARPSCGLAALSRASPGSE